MADPLGNALAALQAQSDSLAKALKETPEAVRGALAAAAPAALASLIGQGESEEGVEVVRTALGDAQTAPALLASLGTRLDGARLRGRAGGAGTRLLGSRGAALVEQLAPEAKIKPTSASALVDLTAPVVLAALRQAGGTPADAEETRALLRRQASSVNRALPAAFQPRFGIVLREEPAPVGGARAGGLGGVPWAVWLVAALMLIAVVLWLTLGRAHAQPAGARAANHGLAFVAERLNKEASAPFSLDPSDWQSARG